MSKDIPSSPLLLYTFCMISTWPSFFFLFSSSFPVEHACCCRSTGCTAVSHASAASERSMKVFRWPHLQAECFHLSSGDPDALCCRCHDLGIMCTGVTENDLLCFQEALDLMYVHDMEALSCRGNDLSFRRRVLGVSCRVFILQGFDIRLQAFSHVHYMVSVSFSIILLMWDLFRSHLLQSKQCLLRLNRFTYQLCNDTSAYAECTKGFCFCEFHSQLIGHDLGGCRLLSGKNGKPKAYHSSKATISVGTKTTTVLSSPMYTSKA